MMSVESSELEARRERVREALVDLRTIGRRDTQLRLVLGALVVVLEDPDRVPEGGQ